MKKPLPTSVSTCETDSVEILNIKEVSDYLRLPVSTLYKLIQEGKLPGVKIGKHWRFMKRDLQDLFHKAVQKPNDVSPGDN